jgi:hypothetical protein
VRAVEYRVVGGGDTAELSNEVNALIRRGWKPWGSLVVSVEYESAWFYQTMVRYEEGEGCASPSVGGVALPTK